MPINTELHIKPNKRSFYLSFLTLSFVLVFPLFFDFDGPQPAAAQAQAGHASTGRNILKKIRSGIRLPGSDLNKAQ